MTAAEVIESPVRERGILFSSAMVLAMLEDRKTSTRRLIRDEWWRCLDPDDADDRAAAVLQCPFGVAGDRLWVRETFSLDKDLDLVAPGDVLDGSAVWYAADGLLRAGRRKCVSPDDRGRKRPGIHMPRWASRITLEITDVRVQRLQDISEDDARAEGVTPDADCLTNRCARPHVDRFFDLWDEINGKRAGWRLNPWAWALTFRRLP